MRIVQYGEESEATLKQVAEQYGVDKEKLWQCYLDIMRANYFQDLCDIARENEEELNA